MADIGDFAWKYLPRDQTVPETRQERRAPDAFRRLVYFLGGATPIRPLDADEELDLITAYQEHGDRDAINTLIAHHMPLLRKLARKTVRNNHVPELAEEILAEGISGFVTAVLRYVHESGARLATFAIYHVAGQMLRVAHDFKYPIRIGTSSDERKALYRQHAVIDSFAGLHGRLPQESEADTQELSEMLGVSTAAYIRARNAKKIRSIPIESVEVWNTAPIQESREEVREILVKAMAEVIGKMGKRRDRDLLRDYIFMLGDSGAMTVLSERYDITRERVGQIVRGALADARSILKKKGLTQLDDFLTLA